MIGGAKYCIAIARLCVIEGRNRNDNMTVVAMVVLNVAIFCKLVSSPN